MVEGEIAAFQKLQMTLQKQKLQEDESEMTRRKEKLERLNLYTLLTKQEQALEMQDTLWPYITHATKYNRGVPTTMMEYFGRMLCARHRLVQIPREKVKKIKIKGRLNVKESTSFGSLNIKL